MPHFIPLNGRTPGGADRPVSVDEEFPPLPPAGEVVVAVVDCGIVLEEGSPHPWFGDHLDVGPDDVDVLGAGDGRFGYLADADGHGTFVSGVVLREAPGARVVVRGALDKADASGAADLDGGDDERVTEAVRSLVDLPGLAVVNLSFGGAGFGHREDAVSIGDVLRQLDPGVAVVASAGNNGSAKPVWPAAFPRVVGVGAVDEHGWRARGAPAAVAGFSNHGAWVDAYAAGVQVLGPFVTYDEVGDDLRPWRPPQQFRGWARWSGTSFAAAVVSGRIAQTVIERGGTGREAQETVLGESRVIDEHGAVWVRSRGQG